MQGTKYVKTSVALARAVLAKLKEAAQEKDRTVSYIVREAVGKHLRLPREDWHGKD